MMKIEMGPYPDDDSVFEGRQISVHIDPYDTWSMDETLAHIILPMLKQLKETKHGSPIVDNEDVPHMPKQGTSRNESAQYDMFESEEQDQMFWEQYHVRWNWVMDEMIWAFEMILSEEYWNGLMYERDINDRVQRGTTLFGKYYKGLWD